MTEDPRDTVRTVPDANGTHWVHVGRAQAFAHPRGRPGLVLWAIAAWFAASGGLEVALAVQAGAPWWTGAMGLASLVAAAGLILRAPWGYVLAVVLPARFVVGFVQGLRPEVAPPVLTGAPQVDQVLVLAQAVISVVVVFHLVEGERPNLIYRRRYRSADAERQVREDGDD